MSDFHASTEPCRVEEPREADAYAAVLSRVAADRRPVIVRRDGTDLAAVVPLEQWQVLFDALLREECERRAAHLNGPGMTPALRPPQEWFDNTDNPFEPEGSKP